MTKIERDFFSFKMGS